MTTTANLNQVALKLGLTLDEWECMEHRLQAGDCLQEVFSAEHNDDPATTFAPEDTWDVSDRLWRGDWAGAMAINPKIVEACIVDSVEGSAWHCGADNAVEDGQPKSVATKARRVLRSCASKVGKFYGREVNLPGDC